MTRTGDLAYPKEDATNWKARKRGFAGSAERGLFEDSILSTKKEDTIQLEQQMSWFAGALEKYGEKSGTGHKRILIPKSIIDKEELQELGFLGVGIAVPEAGQVSMTSFRHLTKKHHIHEFKDNWTLHKDRYHSSTMLAEKKRRSGGSKVDTFGEYLKGAPHIITEGLPGIGYWFKGKITNAESMESRLKRELSLEYLQMVSISTNRTDEYEKPQNGGSVLGAIGLGIIGYGGASKLTYPFAGNRLKHALTGKRTKLGMATIGLTAGIAAVLGYNIFSGKDDAYNTIEGMRHGGMAEAIRKENTDFGSGFTRAIKNVFNVFKRNKQSSVSKLIKERGITVAGSIEEYVTAVAGQGVSKEVIQSQAERLRLQGATSFVKGKMIFAGNVKMTSFDVLATSGVKYKSKAYTRKAKILQDISLYHEVSEIKYGTRVYKAFGTDPTQLAKVKFGSHWSPQVIREEAQYAKSLGKEGIEVAGLSRKTEGINIYKSASREERLNTIRELRSVSSQLRKTPTEQLLARKNILKTDYYKQKTQQIYQEVLRGSPSHAASINTTASNKTATVKKIALASKKTSNTNMYANQSIVPIKGYKTVDGMHPGTKDSFGAQLIKKLTDFGSKYDSVKAFAKSLGMNADDLLKSTRFQKALTSGTQVSELGQGGYGVAHKMRLEIEGHSLDYVKKTISPNAAQTFANMPEALLSIKKSFPIEAKAMQAAGREGITPSLYGHGKDTVFMELLSGKDAYQLSKQGTFLSDKMIEEARGEAQALVQKGVLHKDIAHRNLMVDKAGKKIGLIDFGVTETVNNPSKEWLVASSKNVNTQFDKLYETRGKLQEHHSLQYGKTGMERSKTGIGKIKPKQVLVDPLGVTGMQEQLKDPRRTTRMKNFRAVSTNAVGIGLKAAHKAGRRHSRFASTGV